MDLIIFTDNLYHLVAVTKEMLQGLTISKGIDCMDLCEIIRENFTTYISSKNIHVLNGHNANFYGCICGAEAPQ